MKYRILTDEELSHLEEDFKHFLIVNGIHSEEWQMMNKEESHKAIELVEIFSDTVLRKVYQKLKFIEFRSKDTCMVFNCLPDKMELISIQRKIDSKLDLSTPESIHKAMMYNTEELSFFRSSKSYSMERELELHKMLEQGCVVSSKEFWDILFSSIQF